MFDGIPYAYGRALLSRHRLPPGKLIDLEERERADRRFLLEHAATVGPIFKARVQNEFWICILGLRRCRRFLQQGGDALRPMTLDVGKLFPKGFLRQMQGEDHQEYRKLLVRAIRDVDDCQATEKLTLIARGALERYYNRQQRTRQTAEDYIATLSRIAGGMLIQLYFGAGPHTGRGEQLMAGFLDLGPHGLVWRPGLRQEIAFAELRDQVLQLVADDATPDCIARRVHGAGMLDATLLGNLIYMVEMGRYDLQSLFRWLSKYAAEHPQWVERIAAEEEASPTGRSAAEAFVLETLRLDQSERLLRSVQRDIVFDGFLVPQYSTVRLCLWESHKEESSFAEPFHFDPNRFFAGEPTADQFSPFGLDSHHCPLADASIAMSTAFMRALASHFTVSTVVDGKPIRGAYHWEPAAQFHVHLSRRKGSHAA